MGIFGKNKYDVNFISLPQQVSKNKIDIENLQKIIKQAYKTTTQLTEQSVYVALNTTNITDTTIKSGWLMDPNGLLFQIASVLEDLVYINFWANLKGETGQNGKDGIQGVPGKNGNRIFVLPDEQLPSNYNEYDLLLNIPSYELLVFKNFRNRPRANMALNRKFRRTKRVNRSTRSSWSTRPTRTYWSARPCRRCNRYTIA